MADRSENNSDELGSEHDLDSVGAHSTMPNESSAAAFLAGVKFARTQDAERQNRAAGSGIPKDMGGPDPDAEPEAESMEGAVKARRTRQSFSWRQVAVLEQVFEQDPLPRQALRAQLAERLGVLPRTVQVWFQNRRQKQKQIQQAMGQSPPSFRSSNVRLVSIPPMDHGTCDAYTGPLANGLPLGIQYMQPSCIQPGVGMGGVVTAPMGAAAQYQVSAPHLYSAFSQAPSHVSLQLSNTYLQQQLPSAVQQRSANETASETFDDAAAAAPATVATATAPVMKGAVQGAAGPSSGATRGGAALMMQMQLPVGASRLQGGMPVGYHPSMQHYQQLLPQHPQLNPQHAASVQAAQQAAIAAGGSFVPYDAHASFNVCCGHEGGADTVSFKMVGHEGGAAFEPRDRLGSFVQVH